MPQRRDIDPREITRLLPYVQINEFVDGGKRIRYRLVGTAIAVTYGSDATGKYFDEMLSGERLRYFEEKYRLVCAERRPILLITRHLSGTGVELLCRRVVMPLSEDGTIVNQALTAMSFAFPGNSTPAAGQWAKNEFKVEDSHCEIIRDERA